MHTSIPELHHHIILSHPRIDLEVSTTSQSQPSGKENLSDDEWLKEWISLTTQSSATLSVPDQAQHVHTPLLPSSWREALGGHPSQPLVQFFLNGIAEGFRIGHNSGSVCLNSARKNLDNALQHKTVVTEYLQSEIDNKRVAGPFSHQSANKPLWRYT